MSDNRIILLDISSSMDGISFDDSGDSNHSKFYYAVKFINSVIFDSNYVVVIAFNDEAKIVYQGQNKEVIQRVLSNLYPHGSTNFSNALDEILKNLISTNEFSSLDIITDGEFFDIIDAVPKIIKIQNYFNCIINFCLIDNNAPVKDLEYHLEEIKNKCNFFIIYSNRSFLDLGQKIKSIEQKKIEDNIFALKAYTKKEEEELKSQVKPIIKFNFPSSVKENKWYSGEIYLIPRRI